MTKIRERITFLICIALSVIMLFTLASCGGDEGGSSGNVPSGSEPVGSDQGSNETPGTTTDSNSGTIGSSTGTTDSSSGEKPDNPPAPTIEYTVTFDSNGGAAVESQRVAKGEKATAPKDPTREGYTFDGWYVGEEKWSFIGYVITEDTTLTAKWTANKNTLTFNANGGSGSLADVSALTDEVITLQANTFVRDGYTFMGWSTTQGGEVEYSDGASYKMGTESTYTLYAVWEAIIYNITYELSGGTNGANPDKYTTEQEISLKSPSKKGYTFAGWYLDSGFIKVVTIIGVGTIGDKTFYAKWTPNENTLVFDANGGNGTMENMTMATDSSSILGGCTYAKDGYTFVGWSTNANGGVEYEIGDTYVMGAEPTYTLYAVWEANNNTLVFDANGGSGMMSNVTLATGSSITLASNTFTRVGYTFKGWSTTKGGEVEYGDNATYTMGTSAMNTLYAVWQANENTLVFDANGGSGTMENMTIATDSQAKLTANAFERAGYTFIGWSSTSNGEVEYLDGVSYQMGAGSTYTLYAVWKKNINGLVFNGNGATSGTPSTIELETGKTIVLPQNTFAKTGYSFKGWSTEKDGAIAYVDGASYTMGTEGTYTLYAVWQANNNTLVFDANGGNGSIGNMTIATDFKVKLPQNTFTKVGYTFIGWSTSASGSVEYTDGASYTMGTESINTLYAVWEANKNTITFNANSGVGSMSDMTIATDASANLAKNTFTKIGYHFVGWSTTQNGKVEYTDGASYTMGANATYTLYAVWEANENTLVFNANGGSGNMSNLTIATDSTANLTLNSFTKAGYTFKGWSTTANGEVAYADGASYTMGTDGTYTLYAVWQANNNTLSFNVNGGNGNIDNMTVATNSKVTLPQNTFTRAGYTFIGWSSTSDGKVEYTNGASYTMGTDSTYTLYAVWEAVEYKITYVLNCGIESQNNPSTYTIEDAITLQSLKHFKGYNDFLGWYTDASFENQITEIKNSTGNITLYAKWVTNDTALTFTEVEGGYSITDCVTDIDVVIIPETYNGYPVTTIGGGAFYGCTSLESITIPDSIISIGEGAFVRCTSLVNIFVEDGNQAYKSVDGVLYSKDGKTLICYPLGKNAVSVEIPDTVTRIEMDAFNGYTSLESVTIGNSVTEVGDYAFYNCTSLTSVVIPDSVITIGSRAFYNCTALTSVTIGTGVSQIGDGAFLGCDAIKEVHISDISSWSKINFENNSVDCGNYSNPLYYNGVLSSNVSNVAPFGNPYHSSKWNVDSDSSTIIDGNYNSSYQFWRPNSSGRDETIDDTLQYCGIEFEDKQAVQKLVLYLDDGCFDYHTKFTVKALVDGEWVILGEVYNTDAIIEESLKGSIMVTGAIGIIEIKLDGEVITDNIRIECTEYGAYAPGATEYDWWMVPIIQEVEIFADTQGMVDTNERNLYVNGEEISGDIILEDGITSLSTHFYGCEKIKSIVIPNSVIEIKSLAFSGCDSLTLYCEAAEQPSGWQYNWNISNCPVVWECFEKDGFICSVKNGEIFICDYNGSSKLLDIPAEINGYKVTTIGALAFHDCYSLTSLIIPDSVTLISGSQAFFNCIKLVEVYNLSALDVSSYFSNAKVIHTSLNEPSVLETVEDYIFMTWEGKYYLVGYAGNATELTLPKSYKGNNYEIYEYAFYNCNHITKVTIPNSVISIGKLAFGDCTLLTSVTIGNSVTTIGMGAFRNCTLLESVTIPNNSVTSIEIGAFYGCSSLISITIPNSVTSIADIPFYNCSSLESITVDENNTAYKSIDGVLYSKDGTTLICYPAGKQNASFTIPSSVTSIGSYAFSGCTSLTSMTIGDSVTSIGDWAFVDCTSLTSVTIGNSVTTIGDYAFSDCTSLTSVTFENPNGWWYSSSSSATSGTSISSSSLSNASTAAEYLTSTYYNYYWKRS